MNRLVRTLVGVVVAKAAVAAGWYLYQKSTELENDWRTEGEKETVTPEPVKTEVKETQPEVEATQVAPVVEKVVKPARKRVKTEVVKAEEAPKPKAKRVRKPVAKKAVEVVEEVKTPVKKATRTRAKKTV